MGEERNGHMGHGGIIYVENKELWDCGLSDQIFDPMRKLEAKIKSMILDLFSRKFLLLPIRNAHLPRNS